MVRFCSICLLLILVFILFTSYFNVCVCFAKARVHFQHSAELLSRLVRVEANYSLQLYPDEGHILREPRSIQHFQRTVVNYLQTCLKHSILLDPVEDDEEEDDWAPEPLPFFLPEGLSLDWMPSYALPWVGLPGTRAQEWGPNTSDHLLQLLEKLMYCIPCCTQLFLLLYCMFEALFVYKIHLRWSGREGYWICQRFTKILKHACRNGCMMWISLHCILCVLQI